jgi:hypothetical protein
MLAVTRTCAFATTLQCYLSNVTMHSNTAVLGTAMMNFETSRQIAHMHGTRIVQCLSQKNAQRPPTHNARPRNKDHPPIRALQVTCTFATFAIFATFATLCHICHIRHIRHIRRTDHIHRTGHIRHIRPIYRAKCY